MIKQSAQQAIDVAKVAAGGVSLSPIPFTDSLALAPVCLTMITALYRAYDQPITTQELKDAVDGGLTGLGLSLKHQGLGHATVGFAAQSVAGNLLKLIPGIGTATGALINGHSAVKIVDRLGHQIANALADHRIQDSFDLKFYIAKSLAAVN